MIRKIAVAFLTLAALATCTMWAVSAHRRSDITFYRDLTESISYMVVCSNGEIRLSYWCFFDSPTGQRDLERDSLGFGFLTRKAGTPLSTGLRTFRVWVPCWAAAILLSAYPLFASMRALRRRRLRRREGLCRKCGYNLTGNVSGICPECAWIIPPEVALLIAAAPLDALNGGFDSGRRRRWRLVFPAATVLVVGGVIAAHYTTADRAQTTPAPSWPPQRMYATGSQMQPLYPIRSQPDQPCARCGVGVAAGLDEILDLIATETSDQEVNGRRDPFGRIMDWRGDGLVLNLCLNCVKAVMAAGADEMVGPPPDDHGPPSGSLP